MNIAIIPARGGSKRILRKNVREFCGRPILSYSIEAAKQAHCFDEVMVSTDDEEIAALARAHGAMVPFMRSAHAASDEATTAAAIHEVLANYEAHGRRFEFACCIYPTAPFVTAEILKKGLDLLNGDRTLTGLLPVVRFSFPPQRAFRLENNRVRWANPAHRLVRSQDLEPMYHDAGQFYWLRVEAFTSQQELVTSDTAAMVLPEAQVQDIDTDSDWLLAELKYRVAHNRS